MSLTPPKYEFGTIHKCDCIEGMRALNAESVDLAFADPPFNIGYKYDVYDDRKDTETYLGWSHRWMGEVHRVLKPTGSFWLSIGDEYAAELKIEAQKLGFRCRSWVVWYYTFGVNCKYKFSRSHVHIFHFVKNMERVTFNREAILIPSARQLVYADKRASPGRLPDDTWILRPQDLTDGFNADEDVWYFPRVAGTFKEREGFHGCQMPEQLLGRIVKSSSNKGELVLDPFSGSATTLAVAKKLGRLFIGFDISDEYITRGLSRLASIETGDPLDGSPEPKTSVAATLSYTDAPKKPLKAPTSTVGRGRRNQDVPVEDTAASHLNGRLMFPSASESASAHTASAAGAETKTMAEIEAGIIEAFRRTYSGYSTDRLIADPELNQAFQQECLNRGLPGSDADRNRLLFRMRKAGQLVSVPTLKRTEISWTEFDSFMFASEIAWRKLSDKTQMSLDQFLCDPSLAREFDRIAQLFAPGFAPLQYRWAAIKLRKEAKVALMRSEQLPEMNLKPGRELDDLDLDRLNGSSGLFLVRQIAKGRESDRCLFAGKSLNLAALLKSQFDPEAQRSGWKEFGDRLRFSVWTTDELPLIPSEESSGVLSRRLVAHQIRLVGQTQPILNRLGMEAVVI